MDPQDILPSPEQLAQTVITLANEELAQPSDKPRFEIPGYLLLGELGRGGMGVVYRARQKSPERIVALKVLLAGQHADANLLSRFRTEAELVAKLQHPHIVQIHEVGEAQGFPYFSLEYVSGGSLDERAKKQPLTPIEAAKLVRTLALAMQAAHEAGVIHRDLKPANVLLTADGSPKIADFGLAKQLADDRGMTRTGDIMGTPSYMAPEQASGIMKNIGPACDIYALGAILYELLTGGPPFRGHDPMEIVLQVLSDDPVSIRRQAPKTPADLETICLKCLQKPVAKRYASAQALADDLTRFLEGHPIAARPVSTLEKAWKWIHRRPGWAAMILISALSLVFILSYGAWKNHQLAQALETTTKAKQRADVNVQHAIRSAARRITRKGEESSNPLLEELPFFEGLRKQEGNDPESRYERALAACWTGYIQSELSDTVAADKAFIESIGLLKALAEEFPTEIGYRHDLSNTMYRYGVFLGKTDDQPGALREYTAAIKLLEEVLQTIPNDVAARVLLGNEYNNLAATQSHLGADPEPTYRRAIEVRRKLVEEFPNEPLPRYDLNVSQSNLAATYLRKQRFADAQQVLQTCLTELQSAPASLKSEIDYRRALAGVQQNLAIALQNQMKIKEASAAYAAGVRTLEELVELHPQSVSSRQLLIDAHNNYFNFCIAQAQDAEAIVQIERVIALVSQLAAEFPDNAQYRNLLASRKQILERVRALAAPAPKPPE